MMIRAVMDTNVLVSGLRSRSGASHQLLARLRARGWTLALAILFNWRERRKLCIL